MRKSGLWLLVGSLSVIPFAALAQESATPTADDYVCALTGECGDEAAPVEAAPSNETRPRTSATRGFSLSRPAPVVQTPREATPRQRQTTRPTPRQRQAASRPTQARPAQVRPAQTGRVDLRVAFGPNSSTLSANAYPQIRAFAEALQRPQLANSRVRIEGHTDSSGGRAMNVELSRKRAQSVADFLMSQGIPATRLEVRGYGYDRPLPGRGAAAHENRRVEAVRIS